MPLPPGDERVFFAGATQRLPLPVTGREMEVGYLDVLEKDDPFAGLARVQQVQFRLIVVRHVLVDRTFEYRVARADAMALFIPENKNRPQVNVGDWYYGPQTVWDYIKTTGHVPDLPRGIVYVHREARVWWHVEGVSPASQATLAVRPMHWTGDLAPIEFRGLYRDDCEDPPTCCDAG